MGIFDALTLKRPFSILNSGATFGPAWGSTEALTQIVLSDIISPEVLKTLPMGRELAITIPVVSKARNLLISVIAKWPLVALDRNGVPLTTQPTWLTRTNGNVSPYTRMAWTIDDAIFYGNCLWRYQPASGVGPLNADYVPRRDWEMTDDGEGGWQILIDEQPVDDDEIIFIDFPFEGLVNIAQRTLKGAIDVEEAWVARARNPVPLVDLHRTGDDDLTDEEVKALVKAWSEAMRSPDGAIGSTPQGIELNTPAHVPTDFQMDGRNAIRTDIGSFLNIRASMLDGTQGVDSLTYTTRDGEKNEFYELDCPFWTEPILARLCMDDVTPHGTSVAFDMYGQYNSNGPATVEPQSPPDRRITETEAIQ